MTIEQRIRPLERYRPVVCNWGAFVEAVTTPLPAVVWANTLHTDAASLQKLLEEDGFEPLALRWHAGAFRIRRVGGFGKRWWYAAGLCHGQEGASLVPVRLLDPRPGERVLDLCAAPGGKTAQIAVALGNRGTVIANDVSVARMRALRANIDRLALLNVSTTVYDGANYPSASGCFDRVLVDAPCSCEGTLRKSDEPLSPMNEATRARYGNLQRALLRRAVALCKASGRIVYSTCTFAPEENECVVDAVLRETGGAARVVPATLVNFLANPGITRWNGLELDPSLSNTLRIWPHLNDTGGFFVAVLEKNCDASAPRPVTARPGSIPSAELDAVLRERFAIPPWYWRNWTVHRRNNRGLHVVDADHAPPEHPTPEATGLAVIRTKITPPKLATAGAVLLGRHATRNVIDAEPEQAAAYVCRQPFVVNAHQASRCTGPGHVIVRYRGYGLGLGEYDSDRARVHSMFPKW